jgi:hypothetical protein
MPSGLSSGDLLLIFAATDGDISWSDLQSCTELFQVDNGTDCSLTVFYKKATGSEGASLTFVSNEKEQTAWVAFRITGMADPATDPPEASTGNTGASTSADPDSYTASWGAEDNLWFAVGGKDDNGAPTGYPLPDNQDNRESSAGNNSCNVMWCSDELAQATLNPTAFTIPSEQWVACTVVVRPAAGGTTVQIGDAAISVAGKSLKANSIIDIAAGAITTAGKALKANISALISAAGIAVAGQALVVNARNKIAIVAGSIALAGQALGVNAKTKIAGSSPCS